MVDFSLHLIKGSPSANRKQARSNCVQDSDTSQEETDYVVVDVVSTVNALHPAAKEIETSQTEGHKHNHGEGPKQPRGKIVYPVHRHARMISVTRNARNQTATAES